MGGVSLYLLLPLTRGIIQQDFSFILQGRRVSELLEILHLSWMERLSNWEFFILFALGIFCLIVVKNILKYVSQRYIEEQFTLVGDTTNSYLFRAFVNQDKTSFDRLNVSQETMVFTQISNHMKGCLMAMSRILYSVVNTTVLGIILYLLSASIFWVSLLFLPVVAISTLAMGKTMWNMGRAELEGDMNFMKTISNAVSRVPLTVIAGTQDQEIDTFDQSASSVSRNQLLVSKYMDLIRPVNEILGALCLLVFSGYLGVISFSAENKNVFLFIICFIIFRKYLGEVQQLFNQVLGLLRSGSILKSQINHIESRTYSSIQGGKELCPMPKSSIEITDLSFSYEENDILTKFSAAISIGKTIAIKGRSGCGKSTLASLLLRMYEVPPGTLYFDGRDVHEFSVASVRQHFAYIPQDPVIFNDTLAGNLLFGSKEVIPQSKLLEVIKAVQLQSMLESLPKRLRTPVGDRGVTLSGGEKQRIALARVLLSPKPILILDEATSALDEETERLVMQEIEKVYKGKTKIIISHRRAVIERADATIEFN